MKLTAMIVILMLTVLTPISAGQSPCVPTSADPAFVNEIYVPVTGETYYIEELGGQSITVGTLTLAIPATGFVSGDGTWTYKESNNYPGLQRGGVGVLGPGLPPGCDPDYSVWDPAWVGQGVPCQIYGEAPITDETCGRGPDTLIW